jgi:hypothetical protein
MRGGSLVRRLGPFNNSHRARGVFALQLTQSAWCVRAGDEEDVGAPMDDDGRLTPTMLNPALIRQQAGMAAAGSYTTQRPMSGSSVPRVRPPSSSTPFGGASRASRPKTALPAQRR